LGKVAGDFMPEVRKQDLKRLLQFCGLAFAGMILLWTPTPAFAQNCALCYTQAASTGARMIQALRSGILVLIIPPTLGSIGLIFVVYHKRNQVRRSNYAGESGQDW
jgi:hypothetical protein